MPPSLVLTVLDNVSRTYVVNRCGIHVPEPAPDGSSKQLLSYLGRLEMAWVCLCPVKTTPVYLASLENLVLLPTAGFGH